MKFLFALIAASFATAAPFLNEKRFPHLNETFDDTDCSFLSYSDSADGALWYHNSGFDGPYNGTLSYNNDLSASYSFVYDGGDVSFSIWAGKKVDRGNFDVYLNEQLIGTGDAYDANEPDGGPSEPVFTYQGFSITGQTNTILVQNVADDRVPGGQPWLTLDYITTSS